jgi:hypothetical protein
MLIQESSQLVAHRFDLNGIIKRARAGTKLFRCRGTPGRVEVGSWTTDPARTANARRRFRPGPAAAPRWRWLLQPRMAK